MFTFPLFNSFPAEIHALILEKCPPNDRICLRLTCKYLYTLSPQKSPIYLAYAPPPEILCCKPEVLRLFPSPSPTIQHSFPIRKCGYGVQTWFVPSSYPNLIISPSFHSQPKPKPNPN
ncbi:predicted protein [Sclerotinia sclerotiorum 1980 UF-70]|uniref:F-box domain-containing protein n=1 Tax=Sclerotinia sclerotiorum (strain ATCC 18683 / 1980 / Ss-1) TaxID=665079 RepID=A7F6K4_SCLS1|nr:predicted protein [Sclerotinia sclerotiorum 1980 UF-70]EDN98375.1 predicted protein [Sclerotinia sclerotiorum 1980 UF-70]